jgi:hypothetical protein
MDTATLRAVGGSAWLTLPRQLTRSLPVNRQAFRASAPIDA